MSKKKSGDKNEQAPNSKDFIELEGEITELMPDATFKIMLENGHEILGYLSGKMRMNKIKISLGDKVKVQLSPYNLNRGRITFRL